MKIEDICSENSVETPPCKLHSTSKFSKYSHNNYNCKTLCKTKEKQQKFVKQFTSVMYLATLLSEKLRFMMPQCPTKNTDAITIAKTICKV